MTSPKNALISAACLVILVAGLRAADTLLLPILEAIFLSVLSIPLKRKLEGYGVPRVISVLLVVVLVAAALFLLLAILTNSLNQFDAVLPSYREQLGLLSQQMMSWLGTRGLPITSSELAGLVDTGALLQLAADTTQGLWQALSNLVLVLLITVFILFEEDGFGQKLRAALHNPKVDLSDIQRATENIYKYLAIKFVVSLITGILAGLVCLGLGVDFALLWALVAFLFNFIPNIGSIIASVPPILLALAQFGLGRSLGVLLGYLVINMVLGNIIEPRLMGRRLGLSTLVVFLSLVFWGWVWGPVGMLFSVPLTAVARILMEHSESLQWLAILLGPSPLSESPSDKAAAGQLPSVPLDPVT